MTDLQGKSISVMGAARSGVALARLLCRRGASVLISDYRSKDQLLQAREALSDLPVEWETGGHTPEIYRSRDMVIISPGVSIHHPILQEAKTAGVPVIGEVEMAYRLAQAPFIAVTGTNGKSTTATLIHHILQADGRHSHLAGNIGLPLVGCVEDIPPCGFIVAEISSFQLEAVELFQPQVAVLLNVTVDHMDRHGSFDEYLQAKARIFAQQKENNYAVLNQEDSAVMRTADSIKARKLLFSSAGPVPEGVYFDGESIRMVDKSGDREILSWDNIPLRGIHNLENIMASACVCMALGIDPGRIMDGLQKFKPLHYRMEFVDTIKGIQFFNDSKGTNPDAVRASLDSFQKPVILIAGGTDKGLDFGPLSEKIRTRAEGVVLIGQSRQKIARELQIRGFDSIRIIDDMSLSGFRQAIDTAFQMAPAGGVVLLSPSCASFDMFMHAEHRGEMFEKFVRELKNQYEKAV